MKNACLRPLILSALALFAAAPHAAFASTWTVSTVESSGTVGSYTSLALGSSGRPSISYAAAAVNNNALKYATIARGRFCSWIAESSDNALFAR